MDKNKLRKISENIYQLDKENNMNVPVVVYASQKLLRDMQKDKCIEQMKNVSMLPGIQKFSIVLPDAHQGYGFSIGGVAAFDINEGIISPGGVGYDINCSVRLLKTNLSKNDVEPKRGHISKELYKAIPSGTGKGSRIKISKHDLKEIMKKGAEWAIEKGYGEKDDSIFSEENACMKDADPEFVSDKALSRGVNQLGSIGSGNHFLEIQYVNKIFNEKTANIFGLHKDQIVVMMHCGSRGLGHQVASDYIKAMENEYGHENLPDRQLINAPINSKLGREYYKAMCAAANFAFCNKQILTHLVRETLKKFFHDFKAEVVYDVCHNIAKFEEHDVDGSGRKKLVCVHRKGATRSYGPGKKELPEKYKSIGQPIFIPGSMGTSSYVLVGTNKAEDLTFSSTAHGAGRVMSRHEAIRSLKSEIIKKELEQKNIALTSGSWKGIVEEAPEVYKDVDEVVKVSDKLNIGIMVAKLKPIIVIKG
ncbi:MAG: RtcB family protein [Candidatus Pacearchaeota archaeon]